MKKITQHNGLLIVIIAVLAAAILGVVSAILGFNPVSGAINFITTPIRSGLSAAGNWVADRYNYSFNYESLEAENEQLRQRVAELEKAQRENDDATQENKQLRSLLGLSEKHSDFDFEDAAVTVRTVSNWESTLTINKGSNVDLKAGDCVVDEYGNLVGILRDVSYNSSTLITVADPSLEIGGRIARTDDAAMLEGDFSLMLTGQLKLSYLPDNTELIAGDQIVTSGIGGTYPPGLVVGSIDSILTESSGLTRYAVVTPSADLQNIRYVYVIKSFDVVE